MTLPETSSPQASAWNIANALTVLRMVLVPVFLVTLFHDDGEDDAWRVLAFVAFAVASVTDRVDGEIARKRGLVTDFGKIADPIADKALIGAALIGLSLLDELPWWVTVLVLVREVGHHPAAPVRDQARGDAGQSWRQGEDAAAVARRSACSSCRWVASWTTWRCSSCTSPSW